MCSGSFFSVCLACTSPAGLASTCGWTVFCCMLDSYILCTILGSSWRWSGVARFRSNSHLRSRDNFALHCSGHVFHQLETASIYYITSQPDAVKFTTKLVNFKQILTCGVWFLFTYNGYKYMYNLTEALQNVSYH